MCPYVHVCSSSKLFIIVTCVHNNIQKKKKKIDKIYNKHTPGPMGL